MLRVCYLVSVLLIVIGNAGQGQAAIKNFSIEQDVSLKVMTFNIRVGAAFWDGGNRWSERKDIVIDTISDNDADVIGLQEALDYQVNYIQQSLPQYRHYSIGRNDGQDKGEACSIFYRKDRFQLTDCGTFWMSSSPDEAGSKNVGDVFPRICSWIRLIDKRNETGFYVYNLHMSLSQNSRKKGVKILAEQIAKRKTQEPYIVMGDFNMKVSNSAMEYLCEKGTKNPCEPMVNAWNFTRPEQEKYGTAHGFRGKIYGSKIDHIITNQQTQILDVAIDHNQLNGRYPSDHYPVIATLRLPTTKIGTGLAAEKNLKEQQEIKANLKEIIGTY